tara:strand:+ start:13267 stop:14925 length:1659 start_codon:yes stop_codon:yes gene_type:complete
MITRKIEEYLRIALREAQSRGLLPEIDQIDLGIEKSRVPEADYSSTLPLRLARAAGSSPIDIANAIIVSAPKSEMIASIDVAGPGFINMRLSDVWLTSQLDVIAQNGDSFGGSNLGDRTKVQVEFVSVNPTGPLTVGHGRSAILGDVISRIMLASGYEVQREYYVNDTGNQVDLLGQSLRHHYLAAFGIDVPMPSAGYQGEYVREWAGEIIRDHADKYVDLSADEQTIIFVEHGIEIALKSIRDVLSEMDISFDNWFFERQLHNAGAIDEVISRLDSSGYVVRREGATWFTAAGRDDDGGNVLVKRTGDPTYLVADIAYHQDKFQNRGFMRVIDVMGADHHGHVPRMHSALEALGVEASALQYVLCQMVHVVVDGQPIKQSKRSGEFELLSELVADVGPEATRYFMLARDANSQMEFDIDLARNQTDDNPVHKIRYAHARIVSILRRAEQEGLLNQSAELGSLQSADIDLIRIMVRFPDIVNACARDLEPHHLPHFALELAGAFNSYYHSCKVISENQQITRDRLEVVGAVRQVLANCLSLMGIDAPDEMRR